MNPAIVAEVDAQLDTIVREHNAAIAFAIESGSRAWGFPSPDSDYDCRFVFIRPQRDYLALFPKRDVIETPLTPVLDVNGWDLAKALRLLLKGNAVIIEWLTSPIVYRAEDGFRQTMLTLAMEIADRQLIQRHYHHLAQRTRKEWLGDPDHAALKKVFYVLRPILALRWLRLHPDANVAPMYFPTLASQADLSEAVACEIDLLLQKKAATREIGTGSVPMPLRDLIEAELLLADSSQNRSYGANPVATAKAEDFFQAMLKAL